MKKGLFFSIFISFIQITLLAQGTVLWENALGGEEDDWAYSIAEFGDTTYLIAGMTSSYDGDVTDSLGGIDGWVAVLGNNGHILSDFSFGGTSDDRINAMIQTQDNAYIMAGFSQSSDIDISNNQGGKDIWIFKLDANLNLLWSYTYGGTSDDIAYGLTELPNGNLAIAATTFSDDGDVADNNGISDYWLVILDANGLMQNSRNFGGTGEERARGITTAPDGGVSIIGTAFSTDGDVSNPLGVVDVWLVKTDGFGNLEWEKSLGGTKADQGHDIQTTSNGNYILAGEVFSDDGDVIGYHGSTDAWVVKLDPNGNIIWQNALGGTSADYVLSVQETEDGGSIAVGTSFSTDGNVSGNLGSSDVWIIKLDNNGNLLWEIPTGSNLAETADASLPLGNETIIIGGTQISHLRTTQEGEAVMHGNTDVYAAKLNTPLTNIIPIQNHIDIKIFPNPSMDFLQIQAAEKIISYQIFTSDGQLISSFVNSDEMIEVNMIHWISGVYHITLQGREQIYSAKVTKL
ncbi:MAG: T9SS type A sorting domain-containing protein [Saprospiraceae bacterium]